MKFHDPEFKPNIWYYLLSWSPVPYFGDRAAYNICYKSIKEEKGNLNTLDEKLEAEIRDRTKIETQMGRAFIYFGYIGVGYLISKLF